MFMAFNSTHNMNYFFPFSFFLAKLKDFPFLLQEFLS